jgi:hypothetical protein
MAIIGLLIVTFAATLKEKIEANPRYAKSPKYSVGGYRAFGVGFIVAWYLP